MLTADERFTGDVAAFAPRPGDDPRTVIAHYARAGLAVFPVHAETKAPPPGYLWKARATSNVAHAVDDADYSCSLWGDDKVSVAWALGLDGCVALDLDVDIAPAWWADLRAVAAINTTRRGEHLVFDNPPGLVPGNGTGRFPSSGWGEVRGVGGYIIIAGFDRPGLDAEATTVPFPHPEWLTPSTDTTNAAAPAEVDAFIATHIGNARPAALSGVRRFLDGWTPGGQRPDGKTYKRSRHDTAVDVACWIAREARAGDYPAADGFAALRAWWQRTMDDPRRRDGREVGSVIAWAVGQVGTEMPPHQPPPNVNADTGEISTTVLPDQFWQARPELGHIRQAARAAMVAPDALLGAVLARVAALTPPTRCLPGIIGDTVTLALLVALLGETGDGKTSSTNTARRLLPDVAPGVFTGALGSGEGLIEAFLETVVEKDGDGKNRTVKRQTRHGALFGLDEGRVLAEIGSRNGSTILPILCSAWMGAEIGQANAANETKRHLPFGTYTLGLLSLWQPAAAAQLLKDADGGTPGRFLFLPTADPDTPDTVPPWPGPLDWTPPPIIHFGDGITLAPDIETELQSRRRLQLRRQLIIAPLDRHRGLLKEKVAGLIAQLDGNRRTITVEDWALAEMVMRVSDTTRAQIVESARLAAKQAEDASHGRATRREVAIGDGLRANAIQSMARSIARRIEKAGPLKRGEVAAATSSRNRQHATLDDALDYAIGKGWVVHRDDTYRPGESKPA